MVNAIRHKAQNQTLPKQKPLQEGAPFQIRPKNQA